MTKLFIPMSSSETKNILSEFDLFRWQGDQIWLDTTDLESGATVKLSKSVLDTPWEEDLIRSVSELGGSGKWKCQKMLL